jgi:hypothetical protein
MNDLSDEIVNELAECVRRNEGLRQSIAARGMPVKETMKWLSDHRADVFKAAHRDKVTANGE